jgi:hypothetical protein
MALGVAMTYWSGISATPASGWTERVDQRNTVNGNWVYAMEKANVSGGATGTSTPTLSAAADPIWTFALSMVGTSSSVGWVRIYQPAAVTINAQTASYTLVLADTGKIVSISNASANTLTVPANSSVAFTVGTTIMVRQAGAGQTSVAGAGGVTVNSRGAALKLAGQYAYATLVKVATDTWELSGDIST